MWKLTSLLLLLPCSINIISGLPYSGTVEDMYSSDEYNDTPSNDQPQEVVHVRTPKFISESMSMLVNEGETVRLPCIVDRITGFVLLWNQGEKVLTVANQVMEKRFRMEKKDNGNELIIDLVSPEDAGEYVCQISAYEPKFQTHTIKVRVEPVIETVPGELLVVREGESAALSCEVIRGSPAPTLSWRRKHKDEEIKGGTIKWNSVSRHDAGHYRCMAENGFGREPVTKEVKMEVHHAPHVELENEFIHTTAGEEVKVVCTVHCSPRCKIGWRKDGMVIDQSNQNYYINSLGAMHTLTIFKASKEFFGEYTCSAENPMGKNSANLLVSGLAHPAVFHGDNSLSPWLDRAFLEWSVVSKSPVQSFSLEYRADREFGWSKREVKATRGDGQWLGSITLDNLAPATRYEAKVSSRNDFGYSDFSKVYVFATKGADPVQQPSVSGSETLTSTLNIALVLLATLALI